MQIRRAKQQPWYHKPLPRCDTETLDGTQCTFSATWEDSATGTKFLCKVHAHMAIFKVRRIRETVIKLGEE